MIIERQNKYYIDLNQSFFTIGYFTALSEKLCKKKNYDSKKIFKEMTEIYTLENVVKIFNKYFNEDVFIFTENIKDFL